MTGFGLLKKSAVRTETIPAFLFRKLKHFRDNTASYIQGQDKCPLCGALVDYTWSVVQSWISLECDKGCVLLPKKRRFERG